MQQDDTILIDPMLIPEIQDAINSGHVSVYMDPSGKTREYCVVMPDGRALVLAFDVIGTRCEYSIEIDDDVVAWLAISAVSKKITPAQSQILDLFRCCSNKVIWQETHFIFARTIAGKYDKYYS